VFGDAPTLAGADRSIGSCCVGGIDGIDGIGGTSRLRDLPGRDGSVLSPATATVAARPTPPPATHHHAREDRPMSNALNDELHSRLAAPDGALARVEPALREAGHATAHALDELRHTARDLARGGVHAIQTTAGQARDSGVRYIEAHPAKAMLIAAGAGAVLVLLAALAMRGSGRPR
jgi:ElaB/YqjD/DUF883 family membrane-anchored ribosome-binding protein